MKLLLLVFTVLLYTTISAQEISKCPLAMYSWIHETQYHESLNKKYLAIGDRGGIRVFSAKENGYELISRIDESVGPRTKLHFSDSGKLVVWGDSFTDTQSDVIKIYNKNGNSEHIISAEKSFTLEETLAVIELYEDINDCTPDKPWICWEERVSFSEDEMYLTDALGRYVEINIQTGQLRIDSESQQCGMLP